MEIEVPKSHKKKFQNHQFRYKLVHRYYSTRRFRNITRFLEIPYPSFFMTLTILPFSIQLSKLVTHLSQNLDPPRKKFYFIFRFSFKSTTRFCNKKSIWLRRFGDTDFTRFFFLHTFLYGTKKPSKIFFEI